MGSFDYQKDARLKKVRQGAKYGQYDADTLKQALQGSDLTGIEGYNPLEALTSSGVSEGFNPNASMADYTKGLTSAITADPEAGQPGFGGMSITEFAELFPDQARDYYRSDEYKTATGTMPPAAPASSPGNPVVVATPPGLMELPEGGGVERGLTITDDTGGIDPGMKDFYNTEIEKAKNLARQGRTDFNLGDAFIALQRMGLGGDVESLRREVMESFVDPAGASTGPAAQPQVDVTREQPGVTFQGAGPSARAGEAVGGVTDLALRQQQMDTQRELVTGAEEAGAATRQGLPGLKVADPNLDIRIEEAAAPTGGPSIETDFAAPEMLATGDVEYDPEYFKYETDLQQLMLDTLRQNLGGESGMDAQTASQMADAQAQYDKDEAQTVEDLQRYGVLRGGGDTADVLGELRSGYGRTYSDIMSDQAARQQADPRYQTALDLAALGSDRYMSGGEMIGRLGGQDTLAAREAQQGALERQEGMSLEAQIANQQATEREADISGFLRGARSLEGRGQDIDAQFGRADRQLEQARVLAPQYQSAADMARGDARLQQDVADRNLARGLTITEPTTRERFEEGVRGAQQAESLAEANVTGKFEGENTLDRDRMYQDSKDLSNELATRVTEGVIDAEKALALQGLINSGNIEQVKAELASAGEMQTERVQASSKDLRNQLAADLKAGIIDNEKAQAIQGLINSGDLELAKKELEGIEYTTDAEKEMQTERVEAATTDLRNQLASDLQAGIIDAEKAIVVQELINSGDLELAKKELEGIKDTLAAEKEMQTERVEASSTDLQNQLAADLKAGIIDNEKAQAIQTLINSGNLDLAKEELTGIKYTADTEERMQTERVEAATKDLQNQLAADLNAGIIDNEKAQAIQTLINSGNLDLAKEELTGIKYTADTEERMQTERVEAATKDLQNQLAADLNAGIIDNEKAQAIQTLINSGNLDLAKEELAGIKYTTDAEEGMQTERVEADKEMQTERVKASSEDLRNQLANAVTMGIMDVETATRVQGLINDGNLDLAEEELKGLKDTLASDERMQTERIESQEGQFDSELEFRKAIETGQIDGLPTLQAQLQKAELADRMTARQAESLGQLLALANAMPDAQRATTMAAIAKPIQEFIGGRGYTDTKIALANILNVNVEDYGGTAPGPAGTKAPAVVEEPTFLSAEELVNNYGFGPEEVRLYQQGMSIYDIQNM